MQSTDSTPSRTEGFQDNLLQGVRDAGDHKVAALNFYTLLTEKYADEGGPISRDEFQVEYGDEVCTVRWEGGPYRWTLDVLGGRTIGSTEFRSHTESEVFPEVLTEAECFVVEAENGYAINFYRA